jgi:hypothetical protein
MREKFMTDLLILRGPFHRLSFADQSNEKPCALNTTNRRASNNTDPSLEIGWIEIVGDVRLA